MKYLHLIWAALFRSKTRTFLTLLSVVAAFLLFGMLDSVRVAFNSGGSVTGANRMIASSRLSLTQMLPYSLEPQIARDPGREAVDLRGVVRRHLPGPEELLPELLGRPGLPRHVSGVRSCRPRSARPGKPTAPARSSAQTLAKKFGWKVGDTIPLQATIFPTKGSNDWTVQARRHLQRRATRSRSGQEQHAAVPLELLRRGQRLRQGPRGLVHRAARRRRLTPTASPRPIDALSANSDHETKTQTEEAFNQAFAKQIGDIGLIVTAIMGAVFFTLLLLTGNTMAQAVRERIPELAVLKTIGFTNRSVLCWCWPKSVLLVAHRRVIGLALAPLAMIAASAGQRRLHPVAASLPPRKLGDRAWC